MASIAAPYGDQRSQIADLLARCVVRIRAGEATGTGFFIAPGQVLTCRHTVAAGTGPQTSPTTVEWSPRGGEEPQVLSATITWLPEDDAWPDIALLSVPDAPDHPCVLLGRETVLPGTPLMTGGYPAKDHMPFQTLRFTADFPVQGAGEARELRLGGEIVAGGMSGSPIVSLQSGLVVGILRTGKGSDSSLSGSGTIFADILGQVPWLRSLTDNPPSGAGEWISILTATIAEALTRAEGLAQDQRSATIDRLGSEPTFWLAVAPVWTTDAARAAGFPATPLEEFVEHARDAGWCESRGSRRGPKSGELRFWMPDEARSAVIEVLSERGEGSEPLRARARRVAQRVLSTSAVLPQLLRDWAELMVDTAPETTLLNRVRQAVEANDLSRAQQLVTAGETLAPLLAGASEVAGGRARRLLNLGARRRQDARRLGRYLDRPSLSDAVDTLLRPGAEQWALHLRGVGGVGKTMLIRYLASGRFASDRGARLFPVARADFDHISADYPVRRPAQLLLELSDELGLHTAAKAGADRALSSFRATATSAHEALSSVREQGSEALEHPLVLRALDNFAQALERIPGALLILDTVEELAKADPGNPAPPAVEATLRIIERLHQAAPSMRVLLAGRRPLPARPYLAVCEVGGFTLDEARRYLTTFSTSPLAPGLADAMIRQAAAVDADPPPAGALPTRVSPFDLALYLSWAEEEPALDIAQLEGPRHDAYVEGRIIGRLGDPLIRKALPALALLGQCTVDTLISVMGLDPQSAVTLATRLAEQEWIDADGDPPIHLTVKPALALRMRQYFGAPEHRAELDATVTRLAKVLGPAIHAQPLADINVDELLAALRLLPPADAVALWESVIERAEAPPGRWGWVLNVARRVLGESEDEQWPTAAALRATVSAAYLAAGRRAEPSFNARGLWAEVQAWANHHPDQAAAETLRARAVLGLLPDAADDASTWADLRAAARSPALAAAAVDAADRLLEAGDRGTVQRLQGHLVGALEGIAGRRLQAWAYVVTARLLDGGPQPSSRQAIVAAPAEADAAALATLDEPAWADWVSPEEVLAWARIEGGLAAPTDSSAIAGIQLGSRQASLRALAEAEAAVLAAGDEPAWADWLPPEDLLARVRIERGLVALTDSSAIAALPIEAWETYAAADLRTIDRERLASLCVQLRLAERPVERAEIDRWERLDVYDPTRAPTCSAHDLVPPLFVSLAEAALAAGQPERALALVERRRSDALSARYQGGDDSTLRACDAETVRLVRRLRLDDQRRTLARLSDLGYSDPRLNDLQDAARRAMAVVHREPPQTVGPEVWSRLKGWHAWWQCQITPPAELPATLWLDQPVDPGPETADIELDLEELRRLNHPAVRELERLLAGWPGRPSREQAALFPSVQLLLAGGPGFPSEESAPARSSDPFAGERVALRRAALRTGMARGDLLAPRDVVSTIPLPVVQRPPIPARRLAEVAFEEAELLALRLPSAAAELFGYAAEAYAHAGDPIGELTATASRAALTANTEDNLPSRFAAASQLRAARVDILRQYPDLAATLTGAVPDAGPWRFWAKQLHEVLALEQVLKPKPVPPMAPREVSAVSVVTIPSPTDEDAAPARPAPPSPPSSARSPSLWWLWLLLIVGLAAGLAAVAGLVVGLGVVGHTIGLALPTPLSGLIVVAVLTAGVALLIPAFKTARRLADGLGVGTLRPASMQFTASLLAEPGKPRQVRLVVRPRPLRGAPPRQWLLLALVLPVVYLAGKVRVTRKARKKSRPDYRGSFALAKAGPARITWRKSPKASDRWWRKGAGSAEGAIVLHPTLAGQPWERILAKSLGPGAAGRIEWTRLMATAATPFETGSTAAAAVEAPSAWRDDLSRRYAARSGSQPEGSGPLSLRHAIGRAVATSAGPLLDVSGEAAEAASSQELLGAEQLLQGRPAMVILQAEPTDEAVDVGLSDDAPERLALAADLIEAGVPAVLTLPAFRADLAELAMQLATDHRHDDPRRLRAVIRRELKGHVEPPVLDDIVLFVNPRRDR